VAPVILVPVVQLTAEVETLMHYRKSGLECLYAAAAVLVAGCATHPPAPIFSADAPFSHTFPGSGDAVCWSVKRALLSQGYMLDRGNDSGVLTGSRDEQPKPNLNISTRMQTSCADNRDGTSIVFVTAVREDNRLQKMKQTTSLGVGPATLTMPSGSAQVLGTVRRETVKDPNFYDQFFSLVQGYVTQERLSQAARSAADVAAARPPGNAPRAPAASQPAPNQ
jgi:hypothetical protein